MEISDIRRRRLQEAVDKWFGGNVAALGRAVSRPGTQISDMLAGRKAFGEKVARAIEKSLGSGPAEMPALWLDYQSDSEHKLATAAFGNVAPSPAERSAKPVPVISWVQAGLLSDLTDAYPVGFGDGVEWVDVTFGRHTAALVIRGDSMEPEFREGDVIIVDPDVAPQPGDFVVAGNASEEATFKKYRPRGTAPNGDIIFELVPLNDDYPTLRSDETHLRVIGVMVEHRKRRRR